MRAAVAGERKALRELATCGCVASWRALPQVSHQQSNSGLAQWYNKRTADGRGSTRKTMMVALARKLLIVLWRIVRTGTVPHSDLSLGLYIKTIKQQEISAPPLTVENDPRWIPPVLVASNAAFEI